MDEIRFVAATGAVGAGVDRESLAAALERGPQFIAADAGTTDAGPAALGSGVPAFAKDAVKKDLTEMLRAGREGGIPVIVGSAGTAGADIHVDWTLDIVPQISPANALTLKLPALPSPHTPPSLPPHPP